MELGAIGKPIGPLVKDYTWKDLALYALGVGAGFSDLEYCYEERLKVVPSFAAAAVFEFFASSALLAEVNLAGILHAEQETIFHAPIPSEGRLTTQGRIRDIYDRGPGKGAMVVSHAETTHSNGQRLFENVFTLVARLDGGFGGPPPPPAAFEFPERAPDAVEEACPGPDQPLLYRLSGDVFALHADPDFARACGFERPIMHGLCTQGYACRALVRHLVPGQPERLRRLKVRFTKALYPGEPIRTLIWKVEPGRAVFRTENAKTRDAVLDRGVVEFA